MFLFLSPFHRIRTGRWVDRSMHTNCTGLTINKQIKFPRVTGPTWLPARPARAGVCTSHMSLPRCLGTSPKIPGPMAKAGGSPRGAEHAEHASESRLVTPNT